MSLVAPLFDYADIVWGDKNNDTLMTNLQTLQNRAAKVILDKPKHSSATEALSLLDLKPLFICRRSHRLITMYKYINSETNFNLKFNFNFNFRPNNSIDNYNTRLRNNIYLSKVRTNWGEQRFVYQATVEWNLLSESTRDSQTLHTFKSKL